MAIISFSSAPEKNVSTSAVLNKSELYALAPISGDSFWNNPIRVKEVRVFYGTTEGGQIKIINFDAQQSTPTTSLLFSSKSRNVFQLKKIMLIDYDDGELILTRDVLSSLINVTNLDIDLSGSAPPPVTVTLSSTTAAAVGNSDAIQVTAIFSSAISSFTSETQITVTNGSATTPTAVSSTEYIFDVYPSGTNDGDIIDISIAQNAISEGNTASNTISRTYYTPLTVVLTSDAPATVNGTFSVTATFSRSVVDFVLGDISKINLPTWTGTPLNLSGSGAVYTFDVDPSEVGVFDAGTGVFIPMGNVADIYGITNQVSNELARNYAAPRTLSVSKTGSGTAIAYNDLDQFLFTAPGSNEFLSLENAKVKVTGDFANYFDSFSGDSFTPFDSWFNYDTFRFLMNSNKNITANFLRSFNDVGGFLQATSINTIAFQSDGKIVAAGSFASNSIYDNKKYGNIIRFNVNGTVDETFDVQKPGDPTISGFDGTVETIAIDSSGNIWVGGSFTTYYGPTADPAMVGTNNANRIAKLNSSGVLQKINSGDIIGSTGNGFNAGTVNTIKISPITGDIWAGGTFVTYRGGNTGIANNANRIAKLNSSGVIQKINSGDIDASTGNGFSNTVNAISFDSSGNNIWVGGSFVTYRGGNTGVANNANRIAKLDASGVLQKINAADANTSTGNGFTNGLVQVISFSSTGNIWVGGTFTNYRGGNTGGTNNANSIAKLNSTGVLQKINIGDIDGATGNGFSSAQVYAISFDSSGNIWVGGVFTNYRGGNTGAANNANRIAKLSPSGILQKINASDIDGATGNGFNNRVNTINFDSSGDILIGGNFNLYKLVTSNGLIKLNSSGVKDFTFNSLKSKPSYKHFPSGTANTVLQSDGKIIVYGSFEIIDNSDNVYKNIARLNSDGSLDTSFNSIGGFDNTVNIVKINPVGGDIWVGGNFTSYKGVANNANYVVKLDSSGNLVKISGSDTDTSTGNGVNGNVFAIEFGTASTVWIGGNFTSYKGTANNANYILRLASNGNLTAINAGDTNTPTGNGFDGLVNCIKANPITNDIWIGGQFVSFKGVSQSTNYIAKLDNTGVLQKINAADVSGLNNNGVNAEVFAINFDSSGNIWVGGSFTSYRGGVNNANRIAKLNSSGVLQKINSGDIDGATGNGFSGTVNVISFDSFGDIWVGGNFVTYRGGNTGVTNNANRIAYISNLSGILNPISNFDVSNSLGNGFSGNSIVQSISFESGGLGFNIIIGGILSGSFVGNEQLATRAPVKLYTQNRVANANNPAYSLNIK